jgi:hypothetical protein
VVALARNSSKSLAAAIQAKKRVMLMRNKRKPKLPLGNKTEREFFF